MNVTELEAFIILSHIPYLGVAKFRTLLRHFGSACASLKAPLSAISALPKFEKILPHWLSWQRNNNWQLDLKSIAKADVQVIPYTDLNYPKALLELPDHPILIYVQGTLKPQDYHSLAIVGTRNATIYGNEMSLAISQQLSKQGITIVSGLARGIDTQAHVGALKNGRTIAVIGSGINQIYPSENKGLAEKIIENGAIISEYPMSTPAYKFNFPKRNRIVSGMTQGTLLIEAPINSGAMITMRNAKEQKRKLFALPGRADQETFCGNHSLIKSGQAELIENANDILLHFPHLSQQLVNHGFSCPNLSIEEINFLKKLKSEEINIENIIKQCELPVQQVNRLLMGLVLKKAIKEFPGKIYKKTMN